MPWSTRELAELAGTTVKTIRYYHEVGVLDLPERSSNGYKRYEVRHLVRVLQAKRLSELGVPLTEVAGMARIDEESADAIGLLRREVDATISRLTRIRDELDTIAKYEAPAYLAAKFAPIADELSARQRQLLLVYATVLSPASLERFREMIGDPSPTEIEFEALDAEADDARIDDLARRMLPELLERRERSPLAADLVGDSPRGPAFAGRVMSEAMLQLYNRAQLRALSRLHALMVEAAHGTAGP